MISILISSCVIIAIYHSACISESLCWFFRPVPVGCRGKGVPVWYEGPALCVPYNILSAYDNHLEKTQKKSWFHFLPFYLFFLFFFFEQWSCLKEYYLFFFPPEQWLELRCSSLLAEHFMCHAVLCSSSLSKLHLLCFLSILCLVKKRKRECRVRLPPAIVFL